MKILVVGPSPTHSEGGMATVIDEIAKDPTLCEKFYCIVAVKLSTYMCIR